MKRFIVKVRNKSPFYISYPSEEDLLVSISQTILNKRMNNEEAIFNKFGLDIAVEDISKIISRFPRNKDLFLGASIGADGKVFYSTLDKRKISISRYFGEVNDVFMRQEIFYNYLKGFKEKTVLDIVSILNTTGLDRVELLEWISVFLKSKAICMVYKLNTDLLIKDYVNNWTPDLSSLNKKFILENGEEFITGINNILVGFMVNKLD